jgi:hypothetical protein
LSAKHTHSKILSSLLGTYSFFVTPIVSLPSAHHARTAHQSFNGGNAAAKANDLLQAANSDAMKAALAELRGVTLAPTADPNSVVDSDLSSHAFYFIIAFYVLLVVAACVMWRRGMFSRTTTGDTDEWVQVPSLSRMPRLQFKS